MPFRDAMTTGLTPGLILLAGAGAVAVTGVEAAIPAAALEITKSRRLIFLFIFPPVDGLVRFADFFLDCVGQMWVRQASIKNRAQIVPDL